MTYKQYVTKGGLAHGCINTLANSVVDNDFKDFKPEHKEKALKMKKNEMRIVKARYINFRGANERLEKPYMRWAGEPITMWRFLHDNEYEVPYGMIKEINDECLGLAQRSEICDASGVPTVKEGKSQKEHSFIPVSF